MIYITNVDLVNEYVYINFGLNRSICFQDIEQNLNTDVNQGPSFYCKFAEIRTHPSFNACLRYLQNEEDQIENEGARVFTRFLPL